MRSEKTNRISTSRYAGRWEYAHGGTLLLTLVVLGVFVIMMAGTAALVNRQFHEVVGQEQEEQAFQIAEAGVNYAVWLMDQGLVDFDNPAPISDYEVKDHTQDPPEVLGTFDLTFQTLQYKPGGPLTMHVVSVGNDFFLADQTQTIEATIQSDDLDDFRIAEWDHKP